MSSQPIRGRLSPTYCESCQFQFDSMWDLATHLHQDHRGDATILRTFGIQYDRTPSWIYQRLRRLHRIGQGKDWYTSSERKWRDRTGDLIEFCGSRRTTDKQYDGWPIDQECFSGPVPRAVPTPGDPGYLDALAISCRFAADSANPDHKPFKGWSFTTQASHLAQKGEWE